MRHFFSQCIRTKTNAPKEMLRHRPQWPYRGAATVDKRNAKTEAEGAVTGEPQKSIGIKAYYVVNCVPTVNVGILP